MSLPLQADLAGRLVRRYKRFFADVELADGRRLTVHCPNPGRMLGLSREGSAVRCSTSDSRTRKLRHTLEMIRVGRVWVGLHTGRANPLAKLALEARLVRGLAGYRRVRAEVRVDPHTRLDFCLDERAGDPRPAYVEVKSVTLARGRRAEFPDSVTARGRRHVETLARLRASGARALLLFVVQRGDCDEVALADDIDPDYGRAMREAVAAGVEVRALRARVSPSAIRLERAVPVRL